MNKEVNSNRRQFDNISYIDILHGPQYIDGNAAPQLVPEEPVRREVPKKAPSKKQSKQNKKAVKAPVRKSEKRLEEEREAKRRVFSFGLKAGFGKAFTLLIFACVAVIFFTLVKYINVNVESAQKEKQVARLEKQLAQAIAENDNYELRINSSINYDDIYRVATEELGMVYVSQTQIVNYEKAENEYVEQYKDIN